jgi:DNA polymerase-3 subunit epsilon
MRQVFLDTETTGLNPATGDRIVEIGCIEMVNRKLTGRTLHCYLNPERDMPAEAEKVHGLSSEFLADKPLFAHVADEVVAMLEGAEIIIHNAEFDVGFLDHEFARLKRPPVREWVGKVTDSLFMAREMFPGKSNTLDALCRRLEVDNSHRDFHGALLDAGLLAEVYVRLTRGQDSLVMDRFDAESGAGGSAERVDLSQYELPVLEATEDERAAHQKTLADIDKASGGKTVWRAVMA